MAPTFLTVTFLWGGLTFKHHVHCAILLLLLSTVTGLVLGQFRPDCMLPEDIAIEIEIINNSRYGKGLRLTECDHG